MDEITTGHLTDILNQTDPKNLDAFKKTLDDNYRPMEVGEYLSLVLEENGVSKVQAIAGSGLETHYAYQILNGTRKKPGRDKLICLCIGGQLSLRDTNRVLERGEHSPLYPRRLRDAAIILAINQKMKTVCEVHELLSENDLELLE